MSIKIISLLIIFTFFTSSAQTALAQKDDWNSVKGLVNQEIAFKKSSGEIVFGRLNSFNDTEFVIQIADKSELTNNSLTVSKTEVNRIWLATLRFDERNTTKGALIGAAIGAAIGTGVYLETKKEDADGLESLAIPIFTLPAAGVGALIGYFSKKGHKRGKLIYKV